MDEQSFNELQNLAVKALKEGDSEANAKLSTLLENFESLQQMRVILDDSTNQCALLVAAKSTEQLLTKFWTKYPKEFKVELRSYLLVYLSSKAVQILRSCPELGQRICDTLCKIVALMTKLGWFEDPCYKEIVPDAKKFLQASDATLYFIGMRFLFYVGDSMNFQTTGQTITSLRKVAVSFRDHSLLEAFIVGVNCLQQLNSGALTMNPAEKVLNNDAALELILCCLSFDFIGSNIEEGEDINTVHVPIAWRPYIQDSTVLNIMYQYYVQSGGAAGGITTKMKTILECIVQLSSVKRLLFSDEATRQAFLGNILKGMLEILNGNIGLQEDENHHQICRLIGRLRANYTLSDLVKIPEFGGSQDGRSAGWLQVVCKFTIQTISQLRDYMNGSHYLLAMWSRLVSSIPHLAASQQLDANCARCVSTLKECVRQISEAYIMVTMQCAFEVVEDPDDDLLSGESESTVREQMDKFAQMINVQYDKTAEIIFKQFDECLRLYQNPGLPPQGVLEVESKLSWLTNFISSMICSSSNTNEHLSFDGPLCKHVFTMIEVAGQRGTGRSRYIPFEKAILYFIKQFKKVYMAEGNHVVSTISALSGAPSAALPFLQAVLAASPKPSAVEEEKTIFTAMGIGDLHFIMNKIIIKLCSNINGFTGGAPTETAEVLDDTLEVFIELITNYSSSKMLLSLDTVQRIVSNHTGEMFPFLGYNNENKYRIKFYAALMRLVFSSSEDINNSFDVFIAPNIAMLNQLNGCQNLGASADIRCAIIGVLRDFRGIAEATHNKRTYNLLFDAIFPFFPLLFRIADTYALDRTVTTALLKFMMEFVNNKNSRITFELSSANGILLFQETSQIVCVISNKVMSAPSSDKQLLYQSVRLLLSTLINALSGSYVNFGVFSLYKDPCLNDAMTVALKICLAIKIQQILDYTKLSKAYFGFVEVLFRSHLDVVCQIDTNSFRTLMVNNLFGLESTEPAVAVLCACTFDHLMTYLFLNRSKVEKPSVRKIHEHLATLPDILNDYMLKLFEVLILNSSSTSAYSLTRPILSLLLASEPSFHFVRSTLMQVQTSAENRQTLDVEFSKLLEDIQPSLETSNRDKFTQKLNTFKNNVREFLTF